MSGLSKLRVAELRDKCEQDGVEHAGRTKKQMIELLRSMADVDLDGGDDVEEEEEEEAEEEDNSGDDPGSGLNRNPIQIEPDPSESQMQLKALELKLKLTEAEQKSRQQQLDFEKARWELEKEKLKFRVDNGLPQETAAGASQRDLRHLLPTMGSDDQILSFFHAYEKCLLIQNVDKNCWGRWLPACLNAKASKVYMSLTVEECRNYETVKKAVLDNFRLTSKKYLENFRGMHRSGQESYSMFLNKLSEMHKYYVDSMTINTLEKLVEQNILEQFLQGLPQNVRQFVESRQAKTPKDAAEMADLHFETQNGGRLNRQSFYKGPREPIVTTETMKSNDSIAGREARAPALKPKKLSCYICNGPHLQRHCTQNKSAASGYRTNNSLGGRPAAGAQSSAFVKTNDINSHGSEFVCPIYLENIEAVGYRDSGTELTIVHSKFVPESCKLNDYKYIQGVTGQTEKIPLCDISISSPRFNCDKAVKIRAGYMKSLRYDALLGSEMFRKHRCLRDVISLSSPAAAAAAIQSDLEGVSEGKPSDCLPDCCEGGLKLGTLGGVPPVSITADTQSRSNGGRDVAASAAAEPDNGSEVVSDIPPTAAGGRITPLADSTVARRPCSLEVAKGAGTERTALCPASTPVAVKHDTGSLGVEQASANRETHLYVSNPEQMQHRDSTVNQLLAVATRASDRGVRGETALAESSHPDKENALVSDTDRDTELTAVDREFARLGRISVSGGDPSNSNKDHDDFARVQASDPTLTHIWNLARRGSDRYLISRGLLFEKAAPWIKADCEKLLIVPAYLQHTVLQTAHDDIKGGCHLGARKTMQKINAAGLTFHKMSAVAKAYIRSCTQCQRTAARRTADRVPLVKVPVIGNAFEEIIIDVIGPQLRTTQRRNRYALVIVDAATRLVEVLALRNLKAKSMADALLTGWFFRFGTPKRIKFDQQSSLMSELWTAVLKILDVESHISAPYLHHTTAVAERWIRTVERVLKCYVEKDSKSWDVNLPFVSFALNDAPCETTSFSAHELVYGRSLRSPLHVLREQWVQTDMEELAQKRNVISYLTELCTKLQSVNELAQEHARNVQDHTKTWYDKNSRERTLEPNDKVLVLLPEDARKLYAFWRGPFDVIRRIDDHNYEVSMGVRKNTIMHINLLKKFNERIEQVNVVITDEADENDLYDFPTTVEWTEGPTELNVGNQLAGEQQEQMHSLLSDFRSVFSDRPGRTHLIRHSIKLSDPTPRAQAPYKVPFKLQPQVEAELDRLLEAGLIVESESPWAAPMVYVAKRQSDEVRICCNWKNLNSQTVDDAYPSADPNEVLAKAAGAKYISTIDLRKGFWQVALDEGSRSLTSFRTQRGQYEWTVMGMGLKCSSKTMQRLLDRLLRGCSKFSSSLLDDIVVYSKSFDDHLKHLREILTRLRDAGLTANGRKCQFVTRSIKVLGHTLEDGFVKPSMDKVESIAAMERPRTKSALRSFIGLANYYAHFQPKFADTVCALHELLKRNQPDKLNWKHEHEVAFQQVKQNLMSRPVLVAPDPAKPYILQTDASNYGISAILVQTDENGVEHVVSYSSRKLLPRERNYSVIEKECLAILHGLVKHDDWVYGQHITIQSDHRALMWLGSISLHSPRLARWALLLQRYDLTTVYRKSSLNANADALSRL
jgi:hypothetical protein